MAGLFDGFASTLLGGALDWLGFNASNSAQKSAAAQSQKWSVENWNRENEYNLPANQIKRLEEAGINPKLAFSGSAPSATAGGISTPSVGASDLRFHNLSLKNQLGLQREQIENAKADRDIKSAMVDQVRTQTAYIKARFGLTELQIKDLANAISYYEKHGVFRESDWRKGIMQTVFNLNSSGFLEKLGGKIFDFRNNEGGINKMPMTVEGLQNMFGR